MRKDSVEEENSITKKQNNTNINFKKKNNSNKNINNNNKHICMLLQSTPGWMD